MKDTMTTEPLDILLVDDNEDDFKIVRDLLRDVDAGGFVLEWVETYEDGLEAIRARRHDLILLDFRLSNRTGLELLEETGSVSPRAPVILMTGQGDHDIDVQAMRAGAADYLVKDRLDADLLERAIRYAVERQKSAEALRASEDRYRTFVTNSTEGICRFELELPLPTDLSETEQIAHLNRYAYVAECNETMARIHGFEHASDIIGKRFEEFVPIGRESEDNYLPRFIRDRYRLVNSESFVYDHHGQPKYVLHNLTGVVENGHLHRIWGSQNDITERKRSENAQAQLAAIVESSDDAIFSTTLDGLIVTWNKAAEALYGYSAREMTGQPVWRLNRYNAPKEMNSILERVRRGERVAQF
jgi:PAS domain S-box-containing protein